jgi:hypothetical protein
MPLAVRDASEQHARLGEVQRTPRVSHWSRKRPTLARAAAGIAPSELLIT